MNGQLDVGLVYAGTLSVQVVTVTSPVSEHELQYCNESNELLLKTVSVLEDKPDHDETDPLSQELKRQDLKLSLVMDMLGSLLLQYKVLPPPQALELTTVGLSLHNAEGLLPGQNCKVLLYIVQNIPKPLVFHALVEESSTPEKLVLLFTGVSQNLQDNLDKFIFRHHRRLIAQKRKS